MADVTIRAADGGSFSAYLATPKSGKGPGIVLIQEIFGVNKVMRDLADGFAAQGYTVMCPDLFWRQEPGVQITDKSEAEWKKAFALMQGFNTDKGVDDLKATLASLRKHPASTGKVGSIGYCLGGKLAFLMATRSDGDANVSYYGVGLADLVGEAKNIKKPTLLHVAEKDQFVPPDQQKKVADALRGNKLVAIYTYPGADHAFARVGGQHYDKKSADQANQRTAEFLKKNLGA
ncbi:MAG TPA: dienelactone hydrolase family protein [Stellaceae bacterium]|nr:dienelactone hydrolase family protein [Stellaceae bacterium]